MHGYNRVILIGTLTGEPEIRATANGKKVANFSLATNEGYRDSRTGEMVQDTEFHRIVMWDRLAETTEKYLHKGSNISLEGKLKTRKYQDKNGIERSVTEIIVSNMLMLPSFNGGANGGGQSQGGGYGGPSQNQGYQNPNGGYGGGPAPHGDYNNQAPNYGNQGGGYGGGYPNNPNPQQGSNPQNRGYGNTQQRAPQGGPQGGPRSRPDYQGRGPNPQNQGPAPQGQGMGPQGGPMPQGNPMDEELPF